MFVDRFGTADAFFSDHRVVNYCSLVFMEESSRNRTPDKLLASEQAALDEVFDSHLAKILDVVRPE